MLRQKYIGDIKHYEVDDYFVDRIRELPTKIGIDVAKQVDLVASDLPQKDFWEQQIALVSHPYYFVVDYIHSEEVAPIFLDLHEIDVDEYEFNVDILSKSRKQNYVNARLVYSYILRQKGVGLVRIATSLNKNHATILYLCNNAPFYLKQDIDLNNRYENCLSLFDSEHLPVVEYTRRELLKAYLHLETK